MFIDFHGALAGIGFAQGLLQSETKISLVEEIEIIDY